MFIKPFRNDYEGLNIDGVCKYSDSRLQNLKNYHGMKVKYLKISGENVSADYVGDEGYIDEFDCLEEIYNADKLLYQCYVSRKTLTISERAQTDLKDARIGWTFLQVPTLQAHIS